MWRFGRRIHISWVIAACCLSFVAGVFLCQFAPVGVFTIAYLICGLVLCTAGIISRRIGLVVLVCLGGMMLGAWRAGSTLQVNEQIASIINEEVEVTGRVTEDPILRSGKLGFPIQTEQVDGHMISVTLYVRTTQAAISRGDTVILQGTLSDGFGSFVASIYQATIKGVWPSRDVIMGIRDWFSDSVRGVMNEPEASLGLGFLIGEKSRLPSDLEEALRIAGLTHVVVASGYNLTILVRLGRRLFMRVSKFSATLVAVLLILGFIGVTGLSPSMTRAGLVAGLSLVAWYYGRRFHPFVLLSLVAAISVMMKPSYVWSDVGWALSFAAFIGVMIGAPLFQRYFFGDKKPGVLRQILGETIAAHLLTLPIILLTFSLASHVAIISNLLVLPLVPLAMLMTFSAALVGAGIPLLGQLIAWIAEQVLNYMIVVIYFVSDLPWAKSELNVSVWTVLVMYGIIAAALVYMKHRTKLDIREANVVE